MLKLIKKINHFVPWLKIVIPLWLIVSCGMTWMYFGMMSAPKSVAVYTSENLVEQKENEDLSHWQEIGGVNNTSIKVPITGERDRKKQEEQKRKQEIEQKRVKKAQKEFKKRRQKQLADKKLVALTFDDGPSEHTTGRLLDILAEKKVLATFFVLGIMERGQPGLVQRAEREGHEIETHTMYHQNLAALSTEAILGDYGEAVAVYQGVSGRLPRYVRPPYGLVSDTVAATLPIPMIGWSVDSLDWQDRDAELVWQRTIGPIYDGAVVLLHDIYPTTVDAMPRIIDTLREWGYEFATIDEMAQLRGVTLVPGVLYREFLPQ